jgi:hypothetical protein
MASLGTGSKKETTEWDDILRSKGILPEKSADELAEDVLKGMVEERVESYDPHENKGLDELDEELEDADSDEEAILREYRERRLGQLKEAAMKKRFGPGVHYVPANDWKAEVTNAGDDVYVIVHLVGFCVKALEGIYTFFIISRPVCRRNRHANRFVPHADAFLLLLTKAVTNCFFFVAGQTLICPVPTCYRGMQIDGRSLAGSLCKVCSRQICPRQGHGCDPRLPGREVPDASCVQRRTCSEAVCQP